MLSEAPCRHFIAHSASSSSRQRIDEIDFTEIGRDDVLSHHFPTGGDFWECGFMLAAGTQLGRYVIAAPLGAGAMGEVYRANDSRLDRQTKG